MFIPRANYEKPEKKIVIFTGAGLSAESGVSTFRDSNGLWENHKIEEVCSEANWKKNFELVHNFYNQRRVQLAEVEPNEAHKTIARIKNKFKDDCIVITQNVDDLLERSGVKDILHVHGELTKMECEACGGKWDIKYKEFDLENDRCPNCESLKGVRPDIVFFGGPAPYYTYMKRAFEYLQNPQSILVVVGTMGNVVPIEDIIGKVFFNGNHKMGRKKVKATTILNNLEKSAYILDDLFDVIHYKKATEALPLIEDYLMENFK